MKHNYKRPQKPQEKDGLRERTKLKRHLPISHVVIQVCRCDGMVRETGENAQELWLAFTVGTWQEVENLIVERSGS